MLILWRGRKKCQRGIFFVIIPYEIVYALHTRLRAGLSESIGCLFMVDRVGQLILPGLNKCLTRKTGKEIGVGFIKEPDDVLYAVQ